jgi:hypothetical protein
VQFAGEFEFKNDETQRTSSKSTSNIDVFLQRIRFYTALARSRSANHNVRRKPTLLPVINTSA